MKFRKAPPSARNDNIRLRAVAGFYRVRYFPNVGGLVSYGADTDDLTQLVGTYVRRILQGVTPADLPIHQRTKIELVINLKMAKALGLTAPVTLLTRADKVIE